MFQYRNEPLLKHVKLFTIVPKSALKLVEIGQISTKQHQGAVIISPTAQEIISLTKFMYKYHLLNDIWQPKQVLINNKCQMRHESLYMKL